MSGLSQQGVIVKAEAKAVRERMEAAEELTGVIEKAQKTIVKAEEEAQEARKKIQEAEKERLELMQKAYDTYVKVAQDAFGKLNDPIKISLDEMIANLDQNQKDMEEWTNGLAELSKSGLDKGFIQNLRDMGPGTRVIVSDLLNDLSTTGGEKIEALNKSWAKGAADGTKAVQDEFNDPNFIADTASAIDKIAKKIEDNEAIAIQCEQKILNAQHKMKTAIKNADFEQMGVEIPEGLRKGIDNGSQDAINAVVEMMNAIIEEGRLVLDIHSPSKVFEQIGKYLDDGLALGIDKNAASAIKASMDMAQGVIDGAAKVMRDGSSEQIQIEINKLNSILEENRKAAAELKKSQDIAEKENAVRTAKNAEERVKAQQTYEVIKAPGFGVSAYCNTDDDRLITTEVKQIYVGTSGYSGNAASPKPPPTGTLPVYTPEDAKVAQIRTSDGKLEYTGDGETWNGVIDVGDEVYTSIEEAITTKIKNSSVIGTF